MPTLVYRGDTWPVELTGPVGDPFRVPEAAGGAPLLRAELRWSLAYGSNASPARLMDKGLDARGAVLLPASLAGFERAWEARRTTSTGAVPLTLHRSPGSRLDVAVLGVDVDDAALLDTSEGRGPNYTLGRVGPVAVGARFLLSGALAYGPTRGTRLLLDGGAVATYPAIDQAGAAALFASLRPPSLPAEAIEDAVEGWPPTLLEDLPLFVYGSLQPGMGRWKEVRERVEVVGDAETHGRLTATVFGWPAADFSGDGRVCGTLLRPLSPQHAVALYATCDRIEDAPALFRRVAVVVIEDHEPLWAASYEWNPAQGPAPGTEVADGRWLP